MKHLLTIGELSTEDIHRLLDLTDHMTEVNQRPNPKVPALRGKTVCNLFFEDSTRTRLSFETATKRLSGDVMTFTVKESSVNKGESLRDTVETIAAMGVDAFVVRHRSSGAPAQMRRWTTASVINAGDGWHAHPTQALLDAYTIRTALGRTGGFDGLRIAVVGDIKHSRGRQERGRDLPRPRRRGHAGRPGHAPASRGAGAVTQDFDEIVGQVDVVYLLRMQRERIGEA